MRFINSQNIDVVSSFIECYANLLNESMNVDININFQRIGDNPNNDPLACYANVIQYSENVCIELGLSEGEIHSMIAHELGHILDCTPREMCNAREVNADSMAQVLGLTNELVSGLKKLVRSNLYPNQVDTINERIRVLEIYN